MSPRRSFLFLVFAEEPDIQSQRTGPAIPTRSNPVPIEKVSSLTKNILEGERTKSFLETEKRQIKLKIDAKFIGQVADNKSR